MKIHRNRLMRVAVTSAVAFSALTLSACATQSLSPNPAATPKAQDKTDPNVRCKPTYTQVYQPTLKLGGAGRVIMVPNGEKCEVYGQKNGDKVGIAKSQLYEDYEIENESLLNLQGANSIMRPDVGLEQLLELNLQASDNPEFTISTLDVPLEM